MGTSSVFSIARISVRDHPHAYGDKFVIHAFAITKGGSSPRVWGQDMLRNPVYAGKRIIPTRMGTRCRKSDINKLSKDHPHAYGDKIV